MSPKIEAMRMKNYVRTTIRVVWLATGGVATPYDTFRPSVYFTESLLDDAEGPHAE